MQQKFDIVKRADHSPVATVEVDRNLAGKLLTHVSASSGQEAWGPVLEHLLAEVQAEAEDPERALREALGAVHQHIPALQLAGGAAPSRVDEAKGALTREALLATLTGSAAETEALAEPSVRRLLGAISGVEAEELTGFVDALVGELPSAPPVPPRTAHRWAVQLLTQQDPVLDLDLLRRLGSALCDALERAGRERTGGLVSLLEGGAW